MNLNVQDLIQLYVDILSSAGSKYSDWNVFEDKRAAKKIYKYIVDMSKDFPLPLPVLYDMFVLKRKVDALDTIGVRMYFKHFDNPEIWSNYINLRTKMYMKVMLLIIKLVKFVYQDILPLGLL